MVTDSATFARFFLGHFAQDIEIAQHQRRLGDDADRMTGVAQHFQDLARDLPFPLDRLIGVGIGAERDHLRLVFGIGQLALEQLVRVGLDEQFGLEIEPGRQALIGVGRPRVAIDAAVLAAAIGIDRAVEADIRRLVPADDLARLLDLHMGLERRQFLEAFPAVVERHLGGRLEPARGVGYGAAPAPAPGLHRGGENAVVRRRFGVKVLFR